MRCAQPTGRKIKVGIVYLVVIKFWRSNFLNEFGDVFEICVLFNCKFVYVFDRGRAFSEIFHSVDSKDWASAQYVE